jgi:hypothetical protein
MLRQRRLLAVLLALWTGSYAFITRQETWKSVTEAVISTPMIGASCVGWTISSAQIHTRLPVVCARACRLPLRRSQTRPCARIAVSSTGHVEERASSSLTQRRRALLGTPGHDGIATTRSNLGCSWMPAASCFVIQEMGETRSAHTASSHSASLCCCPCVGCDMGYGLYLRSVSRASQLSQDVQPADGPSCFPCAWTDRPDSSR